MLTYDVVTDASPDEITAIGLAIYERWVAFALGKADINGQMIKHPTGRMASAIRFVGKGPGHVAIILDENMAPEGRWMEVGHGKIDLKKLMRPGQVVPMHRGQEGAYGSAGYGSPVFNSTLGGRAKNVWAVPRAQGQSGFATIPTKITAENADSWVIPAMPATSPAMHLAEMARRGELNVHA